MRREKIHGSIGLRGCSANSNSSKRAVHSLGWTTALRSLNGIARFPRECGVERMIFLIDGFAWALIFFCVCVNLISIGKSIKPM